MHMENEKRDFYKRTMKAFIWSFPRAEPRGKTGGREEYDAPYITLKQRSSKAG